MITYEYDAVGNRTRMVRGGATTTYVYDDNDRLLSETSSSGTVTSSYDDNGNLETRDDGNHLDAYVYDPENRLIAASTDSAPAPGEVSYTYDADGIRTSKTAGGVTTTFLVDKNRDFAQVVVERTGAAVTTYTHGNQLIAQSSSSTGTHFYLTDGNLSTRQLATPGAVVSDTYSYDAFGVLLARSGTTPNAYLYTGEAFDPNVGFYYLRARYYDPSTGRFTTPDPEDGNIFEPVSLHRYLYANADPVQNHDPSGRFSLTGQLVTLSITTLVIFGLALAYTRDLKRSAEIARDNFLFGLLIIVVIAAAPIILGGLGLGGGGTAAVSGTAAAAAEGKAVAQILRELGEFLGQETMEALIQRTPNLLKGSKNVFQVLPGNIQTLLKQSSPAVREAVLTIAKALKSGQAIRGTKVFFHNPKILAQFQEFLEAAILSIPK